MGDTFDWWWTGGDWYDRRQQRAIRALEDTQARERMSVAQSLRDQSSRAATIETRVRQLERALVALVELEDVREQLTQHADAAAVRRYARDVVAQLRSFGGSPMPTPLAPPADVRGYWLHPAVAALDAEIHGDRDGAATLYAEATARDPRSTAVFTAALVSLEGLAAPSQSAASILWGDGETVTSTERDLWAIVATGRLGDRARADLVASLRRRSGFEADAASVGSFVSSTLKLPPAETNAIAAGRAIRELRARLDAAADPALPPRVAAHPSPVTGEPPPAHEGPADDGATTSWSAPRDALAELLATVVMQGAPEEQDTIDRMQAIRRVMFAAGMGAPQPPRPSNDPVGTVRELLAEDLTGTDPASPARARRRLAIQVVAPELATNVARWFATVDQEPTRTTEVAVGSDRVVVGVDGPPPGWEAKVAPAPPAISPWRSPTTLALAAAALVIIAVGIVAGRGALVALGLVPAIAAGALVVNARQQRREEEQRHANSLRAAERRLGEAQAHVTATHDEHAALRATAADDVEAIAVLLDGSPDAAPPG